MRGGGGRGAAPQRRAPPAPRSPRPAGRCLRARRARGGGWGRAGRELRGGGEARAGRSGSVRPRGLQTRLKYPGGGAAPPTRAPLPAPAPGALDLRRAARSCWSARPSAVSCGWPSWEDFEAKSASAQLEKREVPCGSPGAARVGVRGHRSQTLGERLKLPEVFPHREDGEMTVALHRECCGGVNKLMHVRSREQGLAPGEEANSTRQVV
ncbi:uncharacterized protein LOC125282838 [Ursus arctos]|uniref:uncharacterized protein LOC125282838 n=1 Tax=Ursus arctos TaxID=9644 RepID=UPI002548276B|nr:uncharacterized protein LOC125282838 [Ursus arctos]